MNKEVKGYKPAYRAVFTGSGSFVPEKILTNSDIAKMVDTSDEWIKTRTGIETRHITTDDESTAMLATKAAEEALEAAGLEAGDLDIIIVATVTPEMVFPSTASFVQRSIRAKKRTSRQP